MMLALVCKEKTCSSPQNYVCKQKKREPNSTCRPDSKHPLISKLLKIKDLMPVIKVRSYMPVRKSANMA